MAAASWAGRAQAPGPPPAVTEQESGGRKARRGAAVGAAVGTLEPLCLQST